MASDTTVTSGLPLDLTVLPSGWNYLPLSQLVDEERGIRYGIVQPGTHTPNGVPIIRVNDIRNGRINDGDPLRVSEAIAQKYPRTKLQGGEVLLTLVGTVGESAIVPRHMAGWNVARAVAVLPISGEVSASWVNLCLRSATLQHYIRIWCTTTVQATFNLRDVARLPIPVPPKPVRDQIIDILVSLDDKIELNRRMNETLEAMARRLFKSWFVDFDPVHAKAALRRQHPKLSNAELSRRALPNMAPELAELFPDSFEDSSLGLIPRGWKIGRVVDLCRRTGNGGTPRRGVPEYWEPGTIPWLTSGEVRQSLLTTTENRISEAGLATSSAKMWPTWTTVVALYGATAGQTAITAMELCANQACCGLEPKEKHRFYLYLLVSSRVRELEQQARGSAQQNLSKQIVESLITVLPGEQLLTYFDSLVLSTFARRSSNLRESHTLAATRDKLLPSLLSGQLQLTA